MFECVDENAAIGHPWHSDGREKRRQETTTKRYNVGRSARVSNVDPSKIKITYPPYLTTASGQAHQTTKFTKNCLSIGKLSNCTMHDASMKQNKVIG
jgi:hypothetical protein